MGREFDEIETQVVRAERYPAPGTLLLGKYLVVSLIGEGGMGVVLKCKHIDLEDFVAIKCLLPEMMERQEIVARFLREAKAAVKLKGTHVARVHDVGRFPETAVPYIVMEYLEGADLNAIIKHHGAQDPSIAVDLILQACEAIAEAHSLGIIHRDIKASNFFVTQPPNQAPVLKVLDFGIATAPEGTSDLTSTQSVIGTPSYMAPEQMRSSREADARSDIWSIGVVLYELLEGARPFRSDVYSELCLKVGMDPPIPMECPDVPDGLRQIVFRCLEKPIDRRYQTVAELAFDLMPFASDPVAARATVEQTARLLGRRGSRPVDAQRMTGQVQPSHPISSSQPSLSSPEVATILGRPTPMPSVANPQSRSSTSIGASSGQVVAVPVDKPRRRGLVIASTALLLLGLGGGGAYVASSQGWLGGHVDKAVDTATQPLPSPPEPTPTAEPIKVEPTPVAEPAVEPVAKEPVVTKEPVAKEPVVVVKQPPVVAKQPPVVTPKPPVVAKPPVTPPEPDAPGGDLYKNRR